MLAALMRRIADGTISNNAAQQVFDALWTGERAGCRCASSRAKGLKQMNDTGALEKIIDDGDGGEPDNVDAIQAPARTRPSMRWSARP